MTTSNRLVSGVRTTSLVVLAAALAVAGGCGHGDATTAQTDKQAAGDAACAVDNWCIEHGVPEDQCGQCNAKVAAECQRKGDWCKEHNRPESQCFECHPELKAKFIAEYEAKCGKKPPLQAGG